MEIPIKQSSVNMIMVITLTGSFSHEGESGLAIQEKSCRIGSVRVDSQKAKAVELCEFSVRNLQLGTSTLQLVRVGH